MRRTAHGRGDGRPTGETVLKVFVSEKKSLADLGPDAVVPGEFEGVPTDVVVMGDLEPDVDPVPGRVEPSVEMLDDTRRRPLVGGAQMQVDLVGSGMGTLGCFVVENGDATKAYALTNFHVMSTATLKPTLGIAVDRDWHGVSSEYPHEVVVKDRLSDGWRG
jgi:hypothetical protein